MTFIPDSMREVLGADLTDRAERVFSFMAIAEEEIATAMKRWPRRAMTIRNAFNILTPGDLLATGETLYRAHCRELLVRVMKGQDVTPGTDAECCLCFMQASLKAPPTHAIAHAYGVVFARCLPEKSAILDGIGREDYVGQTDEILSELRRKIGALAGRGKKKAA